MEQSPNKGIIVIIAIVLIGALAGGGYFIAQAQQSDSSDVASTSEKSNDNSASSEPFMSDTYKDGTYMATGSYRSPGGQEELGVEITLADGKIQDTNVTVMGSTSTAKRYQGDFAGAYKDEVVGKSINEVKLDAVGGSSLTPNGFEDALNQIRQDAAA